MKIKITVTKGRDAGKVRTFDNYIKACNYADKVAAQYGAHCTTIEHIN